MLPVLLAFSAGIVIDHDSPSIATVDWITGATVLGTLSLAVLRRHDLSGLAVLGAVLAMGGGWHHFRAEDRFPDDLSRSVDETPRPAWVRGVVTEFLGLRTSEGYGPAGPDRIVTRMVLAVEQICDGNQWRRASGQAVLMVAGDHGQFLEGTTVEAAGSLARVAGPLNPGEFDYRAFLQAQGIRLRLVVDDPSGLIPLRHGDGSAWNRWIGRLRAGGRARLDRHLGSRTSPLAAALILGMRDEIDPEVNDAFARTGTTHLLAISGLQLQVVALSLGFLLRLAWCPRRPSYAIVALATLGYAGLVGFAPSVVRSAVMTLTFCLAALVERPTRPANVLALAGLATLIVNPSFLFDVGCQLSFLAIAALFWLAPRAEREFVALWKRLRSAVSGRSEELEQVIQRFESPWRKPVRRLVRRLAQGLIVSAVVWLAAVPLVALRFHLVSPIGILLNLPLIPLTSLALLLGASGLGLGLLWSPLEFLPMRAAHELLRLTESIVRWGVTQRWGHRFVAGPSWGWVAVFYVLLVLIALADRLLDPARESNGNSARRRGLLWCPLLIWLAPGWLVPFPSLAPRGLEGEVLAVGHGLAVVLQLPEGATHLYDCGRMSDPHVGRRIIAPALWSRGVTRLDSVFLSHADQDHFNALPDLIDRFALGEVVIPPGFESEENPAALALLDQVRRRRIPIRAVAAPTVWDEGSTRFRVLHPPPGWQSESSDNARSLVLDVSHEGRHLLLTGDLEQPGLVELTTIPRDEPIDLMLAPHHGGKSANPWMLYDWASPGMVVVSQRMPAPGTNDALTLLERRGIPLLRTWQRGAIHLEWSDHRIVTEGFLDQRGLPRP
jgi:competence protein ComEC